MTAPLVPWADDVWIASAPHSMYGLRIGTRMTVVRLPSGSLLVHSPIATDAALVRALDALGPVAHIVAPNAYHHLYVSGFADAYPKAMLHAPRALRRKRRDLRIDADLSEVPHEDWKGTLVPLTIDGSMLGETLFVHPRSRSVISSDLTENFPAAVDHAPTRIYLKASGVYGKIGWSRLLRFVYRDRKAARRSIDRLLEHDFDRAIIAHGAPIERDGKEAIRETFRWL
jgi:hypothetical protein